MNKLKLEFSDTALSMKNAEMIRHNQIIAITDSFTQTNTYRLAHNTLHFTNGTGKMKDILSLNTNPTTISKCIRNSSIPGSVCSGCYSIKHMNMYSNSARAFEVNATILSLCLLKPSEVPLISKDIVTLRVNSHGELINTTHLHNIIQIAIRNPHCNVVIYTKEKGIVRKVISHIKKKPSNMTFIYSSFMLDVEEELPEYFDKVFTVYTEDKDINCGAKKCAKCMMCYNKDNGVNNIRELVKGVKGITTKNKNTKKSDSDNKCSKEAEQEIVSAMELIKTIRG